MMTASYTIPGLHVREHVEQVPLDWTDPGNPARISVFARELVDPARRDEDLPCLVFLQGGPGGKGPRPTAPTGWVGQALKTHRVILLDQRGTGRSSPVDGHRIAQFENAGDAAEYLGHFRADAIVADAEHLRRTVFGGRRWATLGQSYGGFITLTYLSNAPEGLSECYVTGGLASLNPDADEVYRRTFPRVAARNRQFYARFPHQEARVGAIADRLAVGDVVLPDGDALTVRRFQSIGIDLGMKPGPERLHWLVDEAFSDDDDLSKTFLSQVMTRTSYADGPLFAAIHEITYADRDSGATRWSAQRERERHPEFAEDARPLHFTGEMIFPWMFEEIRVLRPFREAVEVLAARDDWGPLYDRDRLAANDVPVAAAVYYDDMFVDSDLQLQTAHQVGNLHHWVTNEYEHDGLLVDRVFEQLQETVRQNGGGIKDD